MHGLDPRLIEMETRQVAVSELAERMRHGRIVLAPKTERGEGQWDATRQSRLIESLIVRIPTPSLYFDATDHNRWLAIDGSQRLRAIAQFAVTGELALTGLEYLSEMEGRSHEELPAPIRRRLLETTIVTHLIRGDTPPEVRDNIAARIRGAQGIVT